MFVQEGLPLFVALEKDVLSQDNALGYEEVGCYKLSWQPSRHGHPISSVSAVPHSRIHAAVLAAHLQQSEAPQALANRPMQPSCKSSLEAALAGCITAPTSAQCILHTLHGVPHAPNHHAQTNDAQHTPVSAMASCLVASAAKQQSL